MSYNNILGAHLQKTMSSCNVSYQIHIYRKFVYLMVCGQFAYKKVTVWIWIQPIHMFPPCLITNKLCHDMYLTLVSTDTNKPTSI